MESKPVKPPQIEAPESEDAATGADEITDELTVPESEIPGAKIINHPGTPSEAARDSEPPA